MTGANEQSIKERIKTIARKEGRTFGNVWQEVVLERWLVRLAHSEYRSQFIFKGALCLSQYVNLQRETQDLDFLLKDLHASIDDVRKYLSEVSDVKVDDGFDFDSIGVGPLAHTHMRYPGYAVSVVARLGKTRTKVFIDIGVGDVVKPTQITMDLLHTDKAPLFEKEIELWAYPSEAIFAEKLETAVFRSGQNSRMKDYHDLIHLIRERVLDLKELQTAIAASFLNRNTAVGVIKIDEESTSAMQNYWDRYVRALPKEAKADLPEDFKEVLAEINDYVGELLRGK